MPVGYSGTPVAKKLGFKDTTRLVVVGEPDNYAELIGEVPASLLRKKKVSGDTSIVHVFVTKRSELEGVLRLLRQKLNPDAAVWVSWPKKSSKVPSEVTEDTIRDLALPLGFVDIKVCAVSDIWSGLKLAVRRELRGSSAA